MPHYSYLLVEGPHDREFICRLLKPASTQRVQLLPELDPFWVKLVPTTFPHKDELNRLVPVPLFLTSPTHQIAIQVAGGDQFGKTLEQSLSMLPRAVDSLGIILDADSTRSPADRFQVVADDLTGRGMPSVAQPGVIAAGPPPTGIFVIPDNLAAGTLESLLLDCGQLEYTSLLSSARDYLRSIDLSALQHDDLKEFNKPAGRDKAVIHAMASILKPGKTIHVSIQDNRWVSANAVTLPRIAALSQFLRTLLSLP